jgi:general secretion pathway protein I
MPRLPPQAQGFTLLEVLLALAIFALGFGLLLETIATSARTVRVAGDVGHAALWAQNRLDQLGISEPVEEGVRSGNFDEVYRYVMQTQRYLPEDSQVKEQGGELYRIELLVSWGQTPNERTERFSTLRIKLKEGQF